MYADDRQLYLPFKPEKYDTLPYQNAGYLASIRFWMSQNQLKLNDKTMFMIIGKPNFMKDLPPEKTIKIDDEHTVAMNTAKNIALVLYCILNLIWNLKSIVCSSS